eukprot:3276006-Amphidinium_carterae.1
MHAMGKATTMVPPKQAASTMGKATTMVPPKQAVMIRPGLVKQPQPAPSTPPELVGHAPFSCASAGMNLK